MKHRNIFTKNCELYLRIDTPCIYTIQNSLGSEFRSCAKSISYFSVEDLHLSSITQTYFAS